METEILVGGLAAAPIIAALANVIKGAFSLPARFAALLSIGVGVGWDCLAKSSNIGQIGDLSWGGAIMLGVLAGLTASGAYSVTQPASAAVVQKVIDTLRPASGP